jgi:hypothetical protein
MKATFKPETEKGDAGIGVLTVGEERVLLAVRSLISRMRAEGLEIDIPRLKKGIASAGGSAVEAPDVPDSTAFCMRGERFVLRPTPNRAGGIEIIFVQPDP